MHIIILSGQGKQDPLVPLERLVAIMRRLRDPESRLRMGSKQSFETIAPYTIEEAYEVADAIARRTSTGSPTSSAICSSRSSSTLKWPPRPAISPWKSVIERICDKLERRHPHIFGDAEHGGHQL